MKKYFETPSAIILMLLREVDGKKFVVLQRRFNTGYADGMFDLSCSGHVEHGESMTMAAAREAKEELGVDIDVSDIKFVTMVHKRDKALDITYYNGYFFCDKFKGEPRICEPNKCSQVKWFALDDLPDDLIEDRREAVKAYLNPNPYIEFGW